MRFSACHWCLTLGGEPSDAGAYFRGIKAAGCDGVEMIPPGLYGAARAEGLEIVNMTGHAIERGMNRREHHTEIIDRLQQCIEEAASHQIAEIIVFSGNRAGQPDDEGIDSCVRCLSEVVPTAEARGVALTLEALNSHDHPDYQSDHSSYAFSVARQIDSPGLRVLYDIYHMHRMGEDVARDLADNLDWITHLHVAGVPGRGFPSPEKSPNYASLVRAVNERGYSGRWGMEFLPRSPDSCMDELAEAVELFRGYLRGRASPGAGRRR
jgi:hydroxypyruvate isomerase